MKTTEGELIKLVWMRLNIVIKAQSYANTNTYILIELENVVQRVKRINWKSKGERNKAFHANAAIVFEWNKEKQQKKNFGKRSKSGKSAFQNVISSSRSPFTLVKD